nr:MAG TPA: hypothetical protein [Caudoviricetes sp.]
MIVKSIRCTLPSFWQEERNYSEVKVKYCLFFCILVV